MRLSTLLAAEKSIETTLFYIIKRVNVVVPIESEGLDFVFYNISSKRTFYVSIYVYKTSYVGSALNRLRLLKTQS